MMNMGSTLLLNSSSKHLLNANVDPLYVKSVPRRAPGTYVDFHGFCHESKELGF